ncbi:MAG TPA: replicative DNA helicase [Candidatus Brocadiia bacterium]|nr:replicative DNA helicase [Candidatus Brocadiia bacterium]
MRTETQNEQQAVAELNPLPHSIEAERRILGSCLQPNALGDDVLDTYCGRLRARHFYDTGHRLIFSVLEKIHEKGGYSCEFDAANPVVVMLRRELEGIEASDKKYANAYAEIGGIDYLENLLQDVPTCVSGESDIPIVLAHALRRELVTLGHNLERAGRSIADPGEAIDKAETALSELRTGAARQEASSLRDVLLEVSREADAGPQRGLPTGFPQIDYLLGGLRPGALTVVAARTSVGKTTFLLNIAYSVGYVEQRPVGLFSLEMPETEIARNLIAFHGQVDRNGDQGDLAEVEAFANAMNQLADGGQIFIEDAGGLKIGDLRASARRMVRKNGIELLLVDYLQLVEPETTGRTRTRENEVSEVSRKLKALAKELQIPVVAAAQLNRSVESRAEKRPYLSDLRESGAIEQDADAVLLLWRSDDENPARVSCAVAKNRNGPLGMVEFDFEGQFFRFREANG